MADFNLIIKSLDLSNSTTREETLDGIIRYIIYYKDSIGNKRIKKEIVELFDLDIHQQEIDESLNRLIDNSKIERDKSNNLILKSETKIEIRKKLFDISEQSSRRFESFKKNIVNISLDKDYAIVEEQIDNLWEIFKLYIHDCYLTHGRKIIDTLTNEEKSNDNDVKKIFLKHSKELNEKELIDILKEYVENYPSLINSDNLQYLTNLANKTESFYSLGLAKEEYERYYENLKFDWIVFLDTKFLYSILGLHTHPEDQAANFVLEIGKELGIQFKYISKTYDELSNRKKDFEKSIPKTLEQSHIRALLKSDEIDNFAKSYFEKKLDDSQNTPHPSDVVFHAQNNLKSKKVNVYNSKFESLTKFEDYLLDQESDYNTFLSNLDELRIEKGLNPKGQKDPLQVHHDVFLREAILFLRKTDITSFNDAKYFGITLDKTLIKYDRHLNNKKSKGIVIPTFFYPSFLLKKLLRYTPVKTDDYLRAFINTISTPAIENNTRFSNTAIKSVKYFHNMGINDEALMLSCIRDESFLKSFEEKENNDEELVEFIESEINKKIEEKTAEISKLGKVVTEKSKNLNTATTYNRELSSANKSLESNLQDANFKLNQYKKEIDRYRNKKLPTSPYQLNIYDEIKEYETDQVRQDLNNTKTELNAEKNKTESLIDRLLNEKIRARKNWGIFSLILAFIIILHFLLIFFFNDKEWNYISTLVNGINNLDVVRQQICYILVTIILTTILYKLFNYFYKYCIDKESKQNFIKKTRASLISEIKP